MGRAPLWERPIQLERGKENLMPSLEEMRAFFAARVDIYDEHMLNDVEGCREGYARMAALLPEGIHSLLDLGCGTGLELESIFARFPDLQVTGIDLMAEMLAKLRAKFPDQRLTLIEGDYFRAALGTEQFDAAVSFQSLHHFTPEKKRGLFARVEKALKSGGVYVQCDYAAESTESENRYFLELARLKREAHLPEDAFYHYDTPLTWEHEAQLLREAGFVRVEKVWKQENTTLMVACKNEKSEILP